MREMGARSRKPDAPRRRQQELLEVATELFSKQGYGATTTQDIANELGMLKGSLYYYIDSKEDLLFAILEDAATEAEAWLLEVIDQDVPALERLRMAIERHVEFGLANTYRTALYLTEQRSLSPERHAVIAEKDRLYQRAFQRLIEEAQREGSVRPDADAFLSTMAILGALNWIYRWFRPERGITSRAVAQEFAALHLFGLTCLK
jgi:AcrR family transcriptional regulator